MMTENRRRVYSRSWYKRECKFDIKKRKREYNKKIRHMPLTEDSCSRGYVKQYRLLECDTIS